MRTKTERTQSYRYGLVAESIAALYLRCKGYRIVAKRYRNHLGEIDLLAVRRDTLVAVEVKARKRFSACEESIAPWKQQKIARALEGALASNIAGLGRAGARNIRFDAVWVVPYRWPRHIKDAWRV